ncbi:hypothetical protein E2562_007373 [Oryza meyeriana var. granulata]|uniref:Uncharacterized protein n=1 Tax=Oryza meyeriana var. granulata TaxID=110450 RepID=A0A6G1CZM1_9ORYZ|nr:hypothetical protein E2562_007373 [Oryza meyeriana var. granulata]
MASSSGDEEWVYVDEDSKAAPVDASPVDSSGDKEDDNVAAVEGATESAAAGDGELPGGATASEVDADDVTASEKEDDDTSAVGSDDDVSSYGATEVDKYLEYEDDIADGLDGLEIDGAATPPISLNNDDLPPIDAAEEAPAYATKDEDEHPRYDDVPVPYGYLYPAGS